MLFDCFEKKSRCYSSSLRRRIQPRQVVLLVFAVMAGGAIFLSTKLDVNRGWRYIYKNINSSEDTQRSKELSLIPRKFSDSAKELKQPESSPTKKYGVPVVGVNHTIIYNKVPKCGSRSMDWLLARQAIRLQVPREQIFGRYSLPTIGRIYEDTEESLRRKENIINTLAAHPPALFSDHFNYIPIENSLNPLYINMIRDPVDMYVSTYNYVRHGDRSTPPNRQLQDLFGDELHINETYDECVLSGNRACTSDRHLAMFLGFFCGSHPNCSTQSKWSLNKAKKNVENEYLVVGFLEDFKSTLSIMEILAPDLFSGLVKDGRAGRVMSDENGWFRTNFKTPLSAKVRAIMRGKLNFTYQFYDFVKTKFEHLKKKYGV